MQTRSRKDGALRNLKLGTKMKNLMSAQPGVDFPPGWPMPGPIPAGCFPQSPHSEVSTLPTLPSSRSTSLLGAKRLKGWACHKPYVPCSGSFGLLDFCTSKRRCDPSFVTLAIALQGLQAVPRHKAESLHCQVWLQWFSHHRWIFPHLIYFPSDCHNFYLSFIKSDD